MAPWIQALGMSSPLGTLVQGCAAIRAGLSRARPSLYLSHAGEGESLAQPVMTCEASSVTLGFSNVGRLVALLVEALEDLSGRVSLSAMPADTLLFVAMPDPVERGIPLSPELEADESRRCQALGRRVMERALEVMGVKWRGGAWHFFSVGHTSFAQALKAAMEAMAERRCGNCLVIAVDSLCGPDVLPEFSVQRRLKTSDTPTGFVPGEGGVALWLCERSSASGALLGSEPQVALRAVVLGADVARFRGAELPPDGRALAACVTSALRMAGADGRRLVLVGDHNGEEYRAREWGMLLMHLNSERLGEESRVSWFPAQGFGDTGVASGALGLCVAVRSLQRRYSPSPTPVVLSASDEGARAAMVVSVAT
ncbi:hypothetical protein HPC49_00330 [Pyxidicoccus fallax]|uniref:Beta-ketoacyl synthase N-terminal domain-containing protein n=1 Tax=Pyxidicoccus fallax TaxID=394095 RepID=A0A848L636_9BACT|nr:hypothetical protein [Pyxidicoccus fallax]NMO13967.1 hypothetical protein [Pyxidicoccus fallax]NPC76701.1 hypothetical protein [Pyxidicoccus fallax]